MAKESSKGRALITGSIVYDIIFSVRGSIKDKLVVKNGEVDKVNLMFTANNKERYYGGTAGNIAYGLGLLGESPILTSVVGDDFNSDYKKHLEDLGIEMKVFVKEGSFTATFYGISDENLHQIGIFQPNVYYDHINTLELKELLSAKDIKDIKVGIFSPGSAVSMRNNMMELRKASSEATLIFDPSQELLTSFTDDILKECFSLCNIFIGNDTEIAQLKKMYNYSPKDLIDMGLSYVVETLGEHGVTVYSADGEKKINSVKPKRVVETTGAGDAFRSGLLYGLLNDYNIYDSCKFGAFMGAKSVEEFGGQLYKTNKEALTEVL